MLPLLFHTLVIFREDLKLEAGETGLKKLKIKLIPGRLCSAIQKAQVEAVCKLKFFKLSDRLVHQRIGFITLATDGLVTEPVKDLFCDKGPQSGFVWVDWTAFNPLWRRESVESCLFARSMRIQRAAFFTASVPRHRGQGLSV